MHCQQYLALTVRATHPSPNRAKTMPKSLLIYLLTVTVTLLIVYTKPLINLGLDSWSHWSATSISLSTAYVFYHFLAIYVFKSQYWKDVYNELKNYRTTMFFLIVVWISSIIAGVLSAIFLGDLPVSITLGFTVKSHKNTPWHVFLVFLGIALVSLGQKVMESKLAWEANKKYKEKLGKIFLYVNLPALVGFGILVLVVLALYGGELENAHIFANGATAFSLLTLQLIYAIVTME